MSQKRIDQLDSGTTPLNSTDYLIAKQGAKTVKVQKSSAGFVNTTGNESIDGTKTFLDPVVVPDATDGTHATNLTQVQGLVGASSFSIGDIKYSPIAPPANSAWVNLDVADQTLSTTNYTDAGSLRNVKANINSAGSYYTDFTGTVSSSNVTIENSAQGIIFVSAIAHHLFNGGTACLNVNGADYAIVSATVSTRVIAVTGSPTTGSQTCIWYPYRTTSATEIRLHAEGGLIETSEVPFPTGTYTNTGDSGNAVISTAGKLALTATTTAPTMGTPANSFFYYQRNGGKYRTAWGFQGSSGQAAGSGVYHLPLPPGVYPKSDIYTGVTTGNQEGTAIGHGNLSTIGTNNTIAEVRVDPSGRLGFLSQGVSGTVSSAFMGSSLQAVSTTLAFSGYSEFCPAVYAQNIQNFRSAPIGYGVGAGRAIYLGDYTA